MYISMTLVAFIMNHDPVDKNQKSIDAWEVDQKKDDLDNDRPLVLENMLQFLVSEIVSRKNKQTGPARILEIGSVNKAYAVHLKQGRSLEI